MGAFRTRTRLCPISSLKEYFSLAPPSIGARGKRSIYAQFTFRIDAVLPNR
jgi:hypothetical protein